MLSLGILRRSQSTGELEALERSQNTCSQDIGSYSDKKSLTSSRTEDTGRLKTLSTDNKRATISSLTKDTLDKKLEVIDLALARRGLDRVNLTLYDAHDLPMLYDQFTRLGEEIDNNRLKIEKALGERVQRNRDYRVFGIKKENKLVATAITHKVYELDGTKSLFVENVIVDNNSQGKGLGSGLMKIVNETAKHLGCKRIMLFSGNTPDRAASHQMYHKKGYSSDSMLGFMKKVKQTPDIILEPPFSIETRVMSNDIGKIIELTTGISDKKSKEYEVAKSNFDDNIRLNGNYKIFMLKEYNRIIGVAITHLFHDIKEESKPFMMIDKFEISKEHKNNGLDKKLMQAIEKQAHENSCSSVRQFVDRNRMEHQEFLHNEMGFNSNERYAFVKESSV